MNRLFLVVVCLAIALTAVSASASSTTTVVTPGNPEGWMFAQEIPSGSGSYAPGPGSVPLGVGSANLTVDGTGRMILFAPSYAGTRLSDITKLSYSTYTSNATSILAISLQLDVDYDATDANTIWQGRLVYEPYHTASVVPNNWQTWQALQGEWWASGAPGNSVCPQSNPCTWGEVLANFPDAAIRATVGNVNFKAGGPWSGGFTGSVDAFTFATTTGSTTYDFEPTVGPPANRSDCKNGGWGLFNTPRQFTNQGDCIQYVNTGK